MQNFTLPAHIGADGILQLKVPPDFTNTDIKVTITLQQKVMPPSSLVEIDDAESTVLVNKEGILMADVEPLCDLTDIVRQHREGRVEELLQRVLS